MPDVSAFIRFTEWFFAAFMDSVTKEFGSWMKAGFEHFSTNSVTMSFGPYFTNRGKDQEKMFVERVERGCKLVPEKLIGSRYGIKNDEASRSELKRELLTAFPDCIIQGFEGTGSGSIKVTARIPFVNVFNYAIMRNLPVPDMKPEDVSESLRKAERWLDGKVNEHFGAMFSFPKFYGSTVEFRLVFSMLEECENIEKNKGQLDIPENSSELRELLYTDRNKEWVEKELSKISENIHVCGFDTNGVGEDGEHFVLAVSCVWDWNKND